MANQPEISQFDEGVYQLETTDPVQGGVGGVSNRPLLNLANRTKYLKDHVDAVEASLPTNYPVIYPSLNLDFANGRVVDNRVSFSRASVGTYYGPDGLIKYAPINEPRIDYDPLTRQCKGLLIEEARTNLLRGSADIGNGANLPVVKNAFVAPDGTLTASFVESTNGVANNQQLQNNLTPGTYPAGTYTLSIFIYLSSAWSNPYDQLKLTVLNGSTTLANGFQSLVSIPRDMWVRVSVTVSVPSEFNSIQINRDVNLLKKAYVWGRQFEAGSLASSYIPTGDSSVTRAADIALVRTLSPWFNANQGTILVDAVGMYDGIFYPYQFDDGSLNNRIFSLFRSDYQFSVRASNVTSAQIDAGSVVVNQISRIVGAYALNDFALSLNGSEVVSDNTGALPPITILRLGATLGGGFLNGHIRRFTYYPARLANAQLQALSAL